MRPESRAYVMLAAYIFLNGFIEIFGEYQSPRGPFEEMSPSVPSCASLAQANDPRDVLAGACLFTLARVGPSSCSGGS
jgi:hypothetical protein